MSTGACWDASTMSVGFPGIGLLGLGSWEGPQISHSLATHCSGVWRDSQRSAWLTLVSSSRSESAKN